VKVADYFVIDREGENMTQKIDFYCANCECNSDVEWYMIDTLGFEIECPECGYVWEFITDKRGLINPNCQAHDITDYVIQRIDGGEE